jgi:hypothetical protein
MLSWPSFFFGVFIGATWTVMVVVVAYRWLMGLSACATPAGPDSEPVCTCPHFVSGWHPPAADCPVHDGPDSETKP